MIIKFVTKNLTPEDYLKLPKGPYQMKLIPVSASFVDSQFLWKLNPLLQDNFKKGCKHFILYSPELLNFEKNN